MKGESVLWIPGFDHAGIATQVIVEKHIKKKLNLTRHDVGREEFIKHVWNWKGNVQDIIIGQLRKLGASLDWSEQIFTLDAVSSNLFFISCSKGRKKIKYVASLVLGSFPFGNRSIH